MVILRLIIHFVTTNILRALMPQEYEVSEKNKAKHKITATLEIVKVICFIVHKRTRKRTLCPWRHLTIFFVLYYCWNCATGVKLAVKRLITVKFSVQTWTKTEKFNQFQNWKNWRFEAKTWNDRRRSNFAWKLYKKCL